MGPTLRASYATGTVAGHSGVGGLVGLTFAPITASYATGRVTGQSFVGGLVGRWHGGAVTAGYWDMATSGQRASARGTRQTTQALRTPTAYTGLYADWNLDLDGDGTGDAPWHFGTSRQYPALAVDVDGDGQATWAEFGDQRPNHPPVFSEGATTTRTVAEHTATGLHIGEPLVATDADGDAPLTYTLGGADAAAFGLDDTTGQLKTKAPLDYETRTAYAVTVTVRDGAGGEATIAVTITVTDEVDAPPAPATPATTPDVTHVALTWDAVPGASRYRVEVRAADADTWTTVTDTLTAAAHTVALLRCATAYEIRVSAFGDGTTYPAAWSAASAPATATTGACPPLAFDVGSYGFRITDAATVGALVGTVTATAETDAPVTYAITAGNEAGAFALDAATGALTVATALVAADTPSTQLTVRASDGQGRSVTALVTITVTAAVTGQPPPAPMSLTATSGTRRVALTWAAVPGASAYRVQTQLPLPAGTPPGLEAWILSPDLPGTSYTVPDLACGTAYTSRVRAYGDGTTHRAAWGAASAPAAVATAACPDGIAFDAASYTFTLAEDAVVGTAVGVSDGDGGRRRHAHLYDHGPERRRRGGHRRRHRRAHGGRAPWTTRRSGATR